MPSSTTTQRKTPHTSRPLPFYENAGRQPHPHEDTAPWSDEERAAAGLPPIGKGPGTPPQAAKASRQQRDKRAAFEDEQRNDRKASRSAQRHQVVSAATDTAGKATSGLSGMLRGKGGGTLAGTFFGLILFAMGRALLEGGPAEVAGWLGAKFLNKPYTSASTTSASSSSSSSATLTSVVVPATSGSPSSVVAA